VSINRIDSYQPALDSHRSQQGSGAHPVLIVGAEDVGGELGDACGADLV
jgi:hypothetical protein